MKAMGIRLLAVPVLLAATVSFASAQEGAKQQARETTQDVKDAAKKTGHAISDSWITLKIHSQFIPEDALSDSDIDVDTKSGVVMAMRHRTLPIEGVQFHPESVLTEGGHTMLANWLAACGLPSALEKAPPLAAEVESRRKAAFAVFW